MTSIVAILMLVVSLAAAQTFHLMPRCANRWLLEWFQFLFRAMCSNLAQGRESTFWLEGKLAEENVLVIVSGPVPYVTLMTNQKTADAIHSAHKTELKKP